MCTSVAAFCWRSVEPMTTHSALDPSALFLILSLAKVEQEKREERGKRRQSQSQVSHCFALKGCGEKIKGLLKQCIHNSLNTVLLILLLLLLVRLSRVSLLFPVLPSQRAVGIDSERGECNELRMASAWRIEGGSRRSM